MPSYHKTIAGLFVAGAAGDGGVISTNGGRVVLGPSAGGDSRVGTQWLKDTKAICQYYRREDIDPAPKLNPRLVIIDIVNGGEPQLLWPDGANKIVAGAGHWFAVTAHTGVRLDGEIADFNVRAFAGHYMAWFPWNGTGLWIRGPLGDRQLSTALGPEETIQLFEDGSCAWGEGVPRVDGIADYPPRPVVLDGGFGWFKIVKVRGEWWNVYQSYKLASVVAHPATKLVGNKWDATAAFHLDVDPQTLEVIWSVTVADAPQNIVIKRIDPDNVVALEVLPLKIQNVQYDPLIKAGKPWQSSFFITQPSTVIVSKDDSDLYWIRAFNESESDHTGVVRQLTVEGPCKPMPPPITSRYRFSMAIASNDFVNVFDAPPTPGIPIVIAIQNIIFDGENQGPNTWEHLVEADVYRKAKDHGNPLVIEMGFVKEGDCDGVNALHNIEWSIGVVREHGGEVACISVDEPLTADKDNCHQGTAKTADVMSKCMRRALELGVPTGWIEASPHVSFDVQKDFLLRLIANGTPPVHWHHDIFWDQMTDQAATKLIQDSWQLAIEHGIDYGVYINSTKDPIATDAEHRQNIFALAQRIYRLVPDVPQIIVAAWAFRKPPEQGGLQNVPNNFGPDGLLQSLADVQNIFGGKPPQPTPEDIVKFSKLLDGDPLAVKKIIPSGRQGFGILVLPDFMGKADPTAPDAASHPDVLCHDYVFSMQPGGKPGYRKPGTDGLYEQGAVQAGIASFSPDGEFYSQKFVLVGE